MKVIQFLFANLALFAVYFAIMAVLDWVDVKGILHWSSFILVWGAPAVLWSAIPVTCFVNWWLLSLENTNKRIVVGIALGLLAIAIAFVPFMLLGIEFHMSIGGSL